MDTEIFKRIATSSESIVAEIRRWNDYRFNQRLETERRTIDVKIEQSASALAAELAIEKLKKDEEWVQTEAKRMFLVEKRNKRIRKIVSGILVWLTHGGVGAFVYFFSITFCAFVGAMVASNLPPKIACDDKFGPCYLLRFDKSTVVLPENEDERVEAYLKWRSQHKQKQKQK